MRGSNLLKAMVAVCVMGFSGLGNPISVFSPGTEAASDANPGGRPGNYVVKRTAILYEHPSSDSRILRMIKPGTVVQVVEAAGDWYKIESKRADRPPGYIRRSSADVAPTTEPPPSAFRPGVFRVTQTTKVHAAPSSRARTITTLASGAEVQVVGESGSWYRIESERGNRPPGYVLAAAVRRVRNLD